MIEFTAPQLTLMAASYSPKRKPAPLVIGHPDDESAVPQGEVQALVAVGPALFAIADVGDRLLGMVRSGAYGKVSASFYMPGAANNPLRNDAQFGTSYYLRHVGFLGAMPPAVKGMQPIAFSGPAIAATFASSSRPEEPFDFSEGGSSSSNRMHMHVAAIDLMQSPHCSGGYVHAANAIERAIYRSRST